jgi:hypothetical protein
MQTRNHATVRATANRRANRIGAGITIHFLFPLSAESNTRPNRSRIPLSHCAWNIEGSQKTTSAQGLPEIR